jgi:hypothetical protein
MEVMVSNAFKPQLCTTDVPSTAIGDGDGDGDGDGVEVGDGVGGGQILAVIPRRSDEVTLSPNRADFCVSELLDHCLIGEGMHIPNNSPPPP